MSDAILKVLAPVEDCADQPGSSQGESAYLENHLFRQMLEAFPAAIYTTDAAGRLTFYNEAAAALWGYRPMLGDQRWCGSWKLYRPDGSPLPHDECPMAVALKEGRAVRGEEAVAEQPDGTRIPFIPFPTPLYDKAGVMIGAVNLLMDITDRKRAEEYSQRLAAIIESSDVAVMSEDLAGVVTSWNGGAEKLFGYGATEIVGRPIIMLIPSDGPDDERAIVESVRRGLSVSPRDTVYRRKDGSSVDISMVISPIRDSNGAIIGVSKLARDITERKRAQEQQSLMLAELKHRIKNTLATVQAIASQTLKSASAEERAAFSARLQALATVHDLLTVESWNRAMVSDITTRALEPFQESREARIVIEGPTVWLDSNQSLLLAMGLHELATNAVKYGALSNDTGKVCIRWTLSAGSRMCLTWEESGGPPVAPPEQKGFGSLLIERAFQRQSGLARVTFAPDGVVCTLEMQL